MRKIIVYIAVSLDGYIARTNGDIDWLPEPEGNEDYGYADFLNGIDTVLMGNKTYRQVRGFDVEYPYKNYDNYVFTTNKNIKKDEFATFICSDLIGFMKELKSGKGKDIWLVGGGEIVNLATDNKLADELMIFTMPVILGEGLPLFKSTGHDRKLKLLESKSYESGVVASHYQFL